MKQEFYTIFKKTIQNGKQKQILEQREENGRVYKRQKINSMFYQRIMIQLKEIRIADDGNSADENDLANFQEKLLEDQYYIQANSKSNFVIKNLGKASLGNQIAWLQEDYHCLLTELTLRNLNFKDRMKIFHDVASGIKDLSKSLICHRLICPKAVSIIKLDAHQLRAKINRFDNAVFIQSKNENVKRAIKQTNAYSSPELASGNPHGLATDIWSLGLLLNFILYETTENVWINKDHTQIEVPQGTSDWLLELLRSMLHFDMSKRYSITTVLEILNSSQKCIDVLGKYIPIGKSKLKFKKIGTKLPSEKEN